MSFEVEIDHPNDNLIDKIQAAFKAVNQYEVLVGIPDGAGSRKDGSPVSNADLLFIHTNGSPVNRIPPRPVLQPAMNKNSDRIAASMKAVTNAALRGDTAGALTALKKAGLEGQNIAKKYFTDSNGWPPNSPVTVARKGSDRPLVDTGQMRDAITYVVREV